MLPGVGSRLLPTQAEKQQETDLTVPHPLTPSSDTVPPRGRGGLCVASRPQKARLGRLCGPPAATTEPPLGATCTEVSTALPRLGSQKQRGGPCVAPEHSLPVWPVGTGPARCLGLSVGQGCWLQKGPHQQPSPPHPPASPPSPGGPSCWGPRAAPPPQGLWCGPCPSWLGPAPRSGPLCPEESPPA